MNLRRAFGFALASFLSIILSGTVLGADIYTVTTTADSGPGSLRDAITQSNLGNCSQCQINFAVAGNISVASQLPTISNTGVTIDAFTAPGSSPNTAAFGQPINAVVTVSLDGHGAIANGLTIVGNNVTVRGMAIRNFTSAGIYLLQSASAFLQGDYIGTNNGGTVAAPNGRGVVIDGVGAHAIIGDDPPAARNLISGNTNEGIVTMNNAVSMRLNGNYVGVRADLAGALGNDIGIALNSHGGRVGETTGNVISGNRSYGIYATFGNHNILGNLIGTNGSGTAAIPNAVGIRGAGLNGLANSTISGNVISGNTNEAIRLEQAAAGVTVTNNKIGVGSDGVTPLANGGSGVIVAGGSRSVIGDGAGNGNVIANNGGAAIAVTGSGIRNAFRGNSIYSNGRGIDLNFDGPTPNDPVDADSGANNLQNFPTLDKIVLYTTRLEVTASVDSSGAIGTAAMMFDVYRVDSSSPAQGMVYIGSSACLAGNTFNQTVFNLPPTGLTGLDRFVATATSYSDTTCTLANDGTSEFSFDQPLVPCTQPPVSIAATATNICLGGSTTLDAGAGFASYLWSTGATTQAITVSPSANTTYTVTVMDSLGCSAGATVNIAVQNPPAVAINSSGPTTFCSGGSVTLSTSTPGTYQWLESGNPISGATTSSYTTSAAGSYSVRVVNGVCTVTSAPTVVTVNSFPSATVTAPTTVCANSSSSASVPAQSGATYSWSISGGTIDAGGSNDTVLFTSGSGAVTLNVAVTRNGCTSNGSATINNGTVVPTVSAGGPTTFCQGGSVTLTSTGSGSYQWFRDGFAIGGANASTYNATTTGNYSVQLTTGVCPATSSPVSVTVNAFPDATITAPLSICANSSSSASVVAQAGATYSWSISGGTITGSNSGSSISFSSTVSPITLGVTVTLNGCPSTGSANVAVGAFTPSISASGPTSFCAGGSVTLTASSGIGYQWFESGNPIGTATAQTLVVSTSGNYSVRVTNGSNCFGTSAPTAVTVHANPTTTISGPTAICPGASATLDAGAGFASYHWSTGATTRTITVSPAATASYSVTVTDGNGCSANASTSVAILPIASATITAPHTVDAGSTGNTASVPDGPAGTTYAWTITNGAITGGQGTSSITWTAGTITPITIHVTATTGSCSVSGNAIAGVAGQADVGIAIATSATTVAASSPVAITITPSNAGPSNASNVTVSVELAPGFALNSASGLGWSCGTIGQSVVCNINVIPVGPLGAITINATAPADSGSYNVVASISSTVEDTHTSDNSAMLTFVVPGAVGGHCATIPPTLIFPAVGAEIGSGVGFTWSAVPNATNYELWVATGNASPVLITSTTVTSAFASLPAGPITWYVAAYSGADCPILLSDRHTFTVVPNAECHTQIVTLLAPTLGPTLNSPIDFSWTAAEGATQYKLWIAIDGDPPQDISTLTDTHITLPLPPGEYKWFVQADFPGCPSTRSTLSAFAIPRPDPCANRSKATLIAPGDGDSLSAPGKTRFRWSPVAGTSGYRVWASVDGGAFSSLGTVRETTLTAAIGLGAVDWYVESLFDGCASTESEHQSFTIPKAAFCAGQPPILVSPGNGASLTGVEVEFTWEPVFGAIQYQLWVATADNSATLLERTEETSVKVTLPEGRFDWFVRAIVSGCTPGESPTHRFTYTPPEGCGLHRPVTTLPPDDSRGLSSPVEFEWGAVPHAQRYELWISQNGEPYVFTDVTNETHSRQAVPIGALSWYVVAKVNGCPSLASTPSTLTVVKEPAACSALAIPQPRAQSEVSADIEYKIRWQQVPGARFYEVQESSTLPFTTAASFMTQRPTEPFTHANDTGEPITYYYRVRSTSACDGTRSLFSRPIAVTVLPTKPTDAAHLRAAAPLDNPQTPHNTIFLGGSGKGSFAAAAGESFTATSDQPWVTITPSSGKVPANGIALDVTYNTVDLPPGASNATIDIALGASASSRRVSQAVSSTTTVSVTLTQPVSGNPKNTPPPDALIFPAVAHATGANSSSFQSDVRVTNTAPLVMKYQLTFTPSGETGISSGMQTTLSVEPGRTIALDDILKTWFGATIAQASASGALEVRPLTVTTTSTSGAPLSGLPSAVTFAASRMYSTAAKGTYGQFIPAVPFVNFISRGPDASLSSILTLQQVSQSEAFRTNLGLIEGSGDPASVLLTIFGDNGAKVSEFTQTLTGGQHLQLNSVIANHGSSLTDGRIEAKVTSTGGKVTAYASVVDNASSDSLLVTPVSVKSLGASKYVLPGVADFTTGWKSDIRIYNASTDAVSATLKYYPQDGASPEAKQITINGHEVKTFDSVLQTLFGATNSGGALHVTTAAAAPLVTTGRTYNQTPTGSFGQFIPAVTLNDAASFGSRALQLLQVEESNRYRTNLGLAEVSGKPTTVEVSVVPPDSKIAAKITVDLPPNGFRQLNQIVKAMGLDTTYNARIAVKVIGGEGRVTSYASIVDNATSDPTFVPAQ